MPERNFIQRLIDVFVAPVRAFQDVERCPQTWWQPVLLLTIVSAIATYFLIDPVLMPFALEELEKSGELSAEQVDAAAQWLQFVMWGGSVLGVPVTIVAIGLLLHLICGLAMGGAGRLVQTLAVVSYGFLINILATIVRVPLMLLRGTPEVHLGPAALMPVDMQESFVYRFMAQLDVFTAWKLLVIGIGLAIVHRLGAGRVVVILVGLWLVWAVGAALLGAVG